MPRLRISVDVGADRDCPIGALLVPLAFDDDRALRKPISQTFHLGAARWWTDFLSRSNNRTTASGENCRYYGCEKQPYPGVHRAPFSKCDWYYQYKLKSEHCLCLLQA